MKDYRKTHEAITKLSPEQFRVLGEFLFMQRLAYERVHCNVIAMNGCRDLRAEVEDCR